MAALLVLLISAVQIAMCATDCDCFLPAASRMTSHSSRADADGCLCCAQAARVSGHVEFHSPLQHQTVAPGTARNIPSANTLLLDRPPRSSSLSTFEIAKSQEHPCVSSYFYSSFYSAPQPRSARKIRSRFTSTNMSRCTRGPSLMRLM
jgi:hypothetical protein